MKKFTNLSDFLGYLFDAALDGTDGLSGADRL